MQTHILPRFGLLLLSLSLMILISACGAVSPFASTSPVQATSTTHDAATVPMPATQTSCPPSGTARGAVFAFLAAGGDEQIVYVDTTSQASTLKLSDANTGVVSTIVSLPRVTISDAQRSSDGKYVLFLSQVEGRPAIQMIRLDGQGLQTLYCGSARNGIPASISHLVWSPDQQRAVFLEPNPGGAPGAPIVQLLTLSSGKVQTEIMPANRSGYLPQIWLSDTQMYLTGFYSNQAAPPHDVYLLDVRHVPEQNTPPQRVALIQGANWDLNLTSDGKQLILSQCAGDLISADDCSAPSLISTQPATGGTLKIIYASHVHAVTAVRAVDAHTLLFIIGGKYGAEPAPYDNNLAPGLWKIQVDGTHLMQLSRKVAS
jgi:hypothetical protein